MTRWLYLALTERSLPQITQYISGSALDTVERNSFNGHLPCCVSAAPQQDRSRISSLDMMETVVLKGLKLPVVHQHQYRHRHQQRQQQQPQPEPQQQRQIVLPQTESEQEKPTMTGR
ncbi:unnamed protein product [Pleuronectes platessa]|uniref:Uncharacterized protein n=1 Tax=Pleuronectes platessa TaxID=8262 RepID=A0A9N7U523_PLEPL|nr:unnamed protein product [Pleuronectes platessa]